MAYVPHLSLSRVLVFGVEPHNFFITRITRPLIKNTSRIHYLWSQIIKTMTNYLIRLLCFKILLLIVYCIETSEYAVQYPPIKEITRVVVMLGWWQLFSL